MKTKQKLINKTRKPVDNTLMGNAHDIAKSLYKVGVIDAKTMREFDVRCLAKVKEFSAAQIKALRLREGVSQPIFALFLNITASTVKQWEQGEKRPRGTSLKLLNLVAEKGLQILGYSNEVLVG
jgi:putative transcriptional regulator